MIKLGVFFVKNPVILMTYIAFLGFDSGTAHAGNHPLVISDSHGYFSSQSEQEGSERFGSLLVRRIKAMGKEVSYYAGCGFTPRSWVVGGKTSCGYTERTPHRSRTASKFQAPKFSNIFDPSVHDMVIVHLGDNLLSWNTVNGIRMGIPLNQSAVRRNIQLLLAEIPTGTPCKWVGPTYHIAGKYYNKPDSVVDELYELLAEELSDKCELIDSRPVVVTTTPNDGLHHISSDSRRWAEGVIPYLFNGTRKNVQPPTRPVTGRTVPAD